LDEILNNREATDKIAKWAIELSMYDIVYKPRIAIKAQALTTSWPSGQRFKHLPRRKNWSIAGTHKTLISCTNMLSKYMK
jgi:hypothetical protein